MNDIIIVGSGIVGLATGLKLKTNYPDYSVTILDKEKSIARHQSSHNSGVIHSGLYYKPGSLKALNCIKGYAEMIEFCEREEIEIDICGKIVVATESDELPYLNILKERGIENGLEGLKSLSPEEIKDYEPHISGVGGPLVPQTGIADYAAVANKYANLFQQKGGKLVLGEKVMGVYNGNSEVVIETERSTYHSRSMINCAGLYSDDIAQMNIDDLDLKIIPFRGEYFQLKKEKEYLINNLVYPVPNPNFPFLGVHFTRMINGGIEAGPNAVLAFKKEGYSKSDIHLGELFGSLTWPGFIKVAKKYWHTGFGEMYRSFSKAAFTKALQKLLPELKEDDLMEGGSGVRAQACKRDGTLVDDFLILNSHRIMNVCNAPSPAATSSLSIGQTIADKAVEILK